VVEIRREACSTHEWRSVLRLDASPRRQKAAGGLLVLLIVTPAATMEVVVLLSALCVVGISYLISGSRSFDRAARATMLFIVVAGLVTALRAVLFGYPLSGFLGDFSDWFRFYPVAIGAACLAPIRRSLDLTAVVAFVAVANALFALGQLFAPAWFRFIYVAHGTLHHYDSALLVSSRPAGLFGSPGEHGTAAALLAILFLSRYLRSAKSLTGIGLGASVVALIASQSQTSFVAFFAGASALLFAQWPLLRNRRRWLAARRTVVVALCAAPLTILFVVSRLRYLVFLFTIGTGRSSYQLRQELWAGLHRDWAANPSAVLLGGGRYGLGRERTSVVDSDLRYLLYIYGLVGIGLFLGLIGWAIATSRFLIRAEFFAVAVVAVVASWANSFVADPRILAVSMILLLTGVGVRLRPAEPTADDAQVERAALHL